MIEMIEKNHPLINDVYKTMGLREFLPVAILGHYGGMNAKTMLPRYGKALVKNGLKISKNTLPDTISRLLDKDVISAVSTDDKGEIYGLTELGVGIFMKVYRKEPIPQE